MGPGPEPAFEVRRGETQPAMKTMRAENRRSWIKCLQRTFPPYVRSAPPNKGAESTDSREIQVLLGILNLRLNQTLASSFIWYMGGWDARARGRVVFYYQRSTRATNRRQN